MVKEQSSLGDQLKTKLINNAVELARKGEFLKATQSFDQSKTPPSEQASHTSELAYAFYRRALMYQSNQDESKSMADLKTSLKFPALPQPLKSLIEQRLSIIMKKPKINAKQFDEAIERQFQKRSSDVNLKKEFLKKFGLNQSNRNRIVEEIDEISAIGIYRWAGDKNRNEQWSKLIRQFKHGDPVLPIFFGRILAEHVWESSVCKAWVQEVDFIVPVPVSEIRKAERGMDIVGKTGQVLGSLLRIPFRTDFLKRSNESERSRFVTKSVLSSQYSFRQKKTAEIRGRSVLLLDDVMNRGYTASICASLLKEVGCIKVVLLVLAQSESTLQSSRHSQGKIQVKSDHAPAAAIKDSAIDQAKYSK